MSTTTAFLNLIDRERNRFVEDELVLPYLVGDDSERAHSSAMWWAYGNNAGFAYWAYQKIGRGLLWGPVPLDSSGNRLTFSAALNAIESGEPFELPMAYSKLADFLDSTVPHDLSEVIRRAVEEYQPKTEVNLLLRRAEGSWGVFSGRFGAGGFMCATPAEFYEAGQKGMSPAEFYNAMKQKRQGESAWKLRHN